MDKTDYTAICKELGFRPEARFVKVLRNQHGITIGFTAGHPEEILELAQACLAHGYRMSAGLKARLQNL